MHAANGTEEPRASRAAVSAAVLGLALLFFGSVPHPTAAASFEAKKMLQTALTIEMQPGETRTFSVGYKNVGTETWRRSGARFVSVYTWNPKYRVSPFADTSWKAPRQPAVLKADTPPGQIGYVEFKLKAPSAAGTYVETYQLAAEDLLWIPGGEVKVTLVVRGAAVAPSTPTVTPAPSNTSPTPAPVATSGFKALALLKSAQSITITRGGDEAQFRVLMKNVGEASWPVAQIAAGAPGVSIASVQPSFRASTWVSDAVAQAVSQPVPAGQTTFFTFNIRAPQKRGNYTATFHVLVDGQPAEGGLIEIPVSVTNDGPEATAVQPPAPTPATGLVLDPEPNIRVGVLIVDEETNWQVVLQNPSGFDVVDGVSNTVLASVPPNGAVTAGVLNAAYWYDLGTGRLSTMNFLRFVPKEANSIFTVTNFDWRLTRNGGYPDNTFRHILELRWSPKRQRTWLINELGMEWYLRGLAETSNISPLEFQKALITGARTYAYYHWQRGTKHADEFYHVDAYADQVYKGYGQELRTPRLTQSVMETRGIIVTYEGRTAITPYFSRSDGRTRNWEEVWNSEPVPWLRGVSVPCDAGKTLWGHGVGLSASGALCMANQGQTWEQILKYFYTGVALVPRWN